MMVRRVMLMARLPGSDGSAIIISRWEATPPARIQLSRGRVKWRRGRICGTSGLLTVLSQTGWFLRASAFVLAFLPYVSSQTVME